MITFDAINLILILGGGLTFCLSLVVLFFKFKLFSSKVLFLQGLFFSLWGLFFVLFRSDNLMDKEVLSVFMLASLLLSSVFLLLFSYFFPFVGKQKKGDIVWLWLSVSLGSIILSFLFVPGAVFSVNSVNLAIKTGYLYDVYWILTLLFIVFSIFYFIKKYIVAGNIEKAKIFYVTLNYTILFIVISIINLLFPKFGIFDYYWLGILISYIIFILNIYAVVVKRFVDLRVALRKAFTFLGAAFFSYLSYYGITALFLSLFGKIFIWQGYLIGAFLSVIFVYLFYINDHFLIKVANKYFFVDLYKYQSSIDNLMDELIYHVHIKEIVSLTLNTIREVVRSEDVRIFITHKDKKICNNVGDVKGLSFIDDKNILVKYFNKDLKNKDFLITDELELNCSKGNVKKNSFDYKVLKELKDDNIYLILPLKIKGNLIGLVALGKKSLNFTYNSNDLKVLGTLIKQVSVAVDRSLLYCKLEEQSKELADFNKILKIKVNKQTKDIRNKNKKLEELLDLKKDFLRVVNHQLNTPISIIKNSFSMIEDGTFSPKEGLVYAKAGLDRMDNTVNDFWQAFAWEGENIKLNLEPDDIYKITEDIVNNKKQIQEIKNKEVKLKLKKPNFKMPLVLCDRKNIVHVISNLVDNALHYTISGSVEICFTREKNNKIKFSIKDTGIGIKSSEIEYIFDKFTRGEKAVSINSDGSGLGLYIAKKIVEAHNGDLIVEKTALNKGTTFSFFLDIASRKIFKDKKDIKSIKNNKRKNRKKEKNIKVFMVEDEVNLVSMYEKYFVRNGFAFDSALTVKEFEGKYNNLNKFDVIILDIIMPKNIKNGKVDSVSEQGWDLLKKIKKDKNIKNIPVIIFTNLNSNEDRDKAKKLGAYKFIFKEGTKPEKLLEIINKINQ